MQAPAVRGEAGPDVDVLFVRVQRRRPPAYLLPIAWGDPAGVTRTRCSSRARAYLTLVDPQQ